MSLNWFQFEVTFDGETLEIVGPVQGDEMGNTYVWIPTLKTVIAGDIVYSGVHAWTAETKPAERKVWSETLAILKFGADAAFAPPNKG